jgi:prophage regulatory protein
MARTVAPSRPDGIYAMSMLDPSMDLRAIRITEVLRLTGLSRSQIYRMEAASNFPRRVALTARTTAWLSHEVEGWLADRVAASRGPTS